MLSRTGADFVFPTLIAQILIVLDTSFGNKGFYIFAQNCLLVVQGLISKKNVPKGSIQDYQDLGDKSWKNKICTRSGKHRYNIGLFAFLIGELGKEKTKQWLEAVKNNLARKPQGNDRAQVKAIYAGECEFEFRQFLLPRRDGK